MTYYPNIPQPPDIPAESQSGFISDFSVLNQLFSIDHVQLGNSIENASNENPCKITSTGHGLSNGNSVTVSNMRGEGAAPDELVAWGLAGPYVISNVTTDTFTIPIDTTNTDTYPAYVANTGDFSSASYSYGFHTKLSLPTPIAAPNLNPPFSTLFSTITGTNPFLNFQNLSSSSKRLNDIPLTQIATGSGFTTPWGYIINFGQIKCTNAGETFSYAVPYTSSVISMVATINESLNLNPLFVFSVSPISLSQFKAVGPGQGPITLWYFSIGI